MSSDNNRQENTHISETDLTIVQVAVPLPIRQKTPIIYDYLVPAEMTVTTRMIVQVPLGKRPVWGIVIHDAPSGDVNHAKLKLILQTAAACFIRGASSILHTADHQAFAWSCG